MLFAEDRRQNKMKTTMMVLHGLWSVSTLWLLGLYFGSTNQYPVWVKLLALAAFAGTAFCAFIVGVWIKRTF